MVRIDVGTRQRYADSMPANNRFAHQDYTSAKPRAPFDVIRPPAPETPDSDPAAATLAEVGRQMRTHNVVAAYLVHGTLTGTDALGFGRELRRVIPQAAAQLAGAQKSLVDSLLGETANYTRPFASHFQQAINVAAIDQIPVKRFVWSSENHHFGRAEAAVRLALELSSLNLRPTDRVLLWGHSHAGNVFALLTNLLGSQPDVVKPFLRAVRPLLKEDLASDWRVLEELVTRPTSIGGQLDIVTFGTPIRYGWETQGCGNLLHFVNHRPVGELPAYRVPFPQSVDQIARAECGDFFQQFFIAGTNFPSNLFAWAQWSVERRLGRLLQHGLPRRKLWQLLKFGQRVPADGTTLLVDYASADAEGGPSALGHGVYTRENWLAFHAKEVSDRFYGDLRT